MKSATASGRDTVIAWDAAVGSRFNDESIDYRTAQQESVVQIGYPSGEVALQSLGHVELFFPRRGGTGERCGEGVFATGTVEPIGDLLDSQVGVAFVDYYGAFREGGDRSGDITSPRDCPEFS